MYWGEDVMMRLRRFIRNKGDIHGYKNNRILKTHIHIIIIIIIGVPQYGYHDFPFISHSLFSLLLLATDGGVTVTLDASPVATLAVGGHCSGV